MVQCQQRVKYDINIGPRDIIRRASETNVFIPCQFGSRHFFPAWEINDRQYIITRIPEEFTPTPHGLLIPQLQKSFNGTTFRCIGAEERSEIGTLYVL